MMIWTPPSEGKADLVHQLSLSGCVMPQHLAADRCNSFETGSGERERRTIDDRAGRTKSKSSETVN